MEWENRAVRTNLHLLVYGLIENLLYIRHSVRYKDTNMSKLELLLTKSSQSNRKHRKVK